MNGVSSFYTCWNATLLPYSHGLALKLRYIQFPFNLILYLFADVVTRQHSNRKCREMPKETNDFRNIRFSIYYQHYAWEYSNPPTRIFNGFYILESYGIRKIQYYITTLFAFCKRIFYFYPRNLVFSNTYMN